MGNANTEMFIFNSRNPSSSTEHVLVLTCIHGTNIHGVSRFKWMPLTVLNMRVVCKYPFARSENVETVSLHCSLSVGICAFSSSIVRDLDCLLSSQKQLYFQRVAISIHSGF